jgi:hypothetical protein
MRKRSWGAAAGSAVAVAALGGVVVMTSAVDTGSIDTGSDDTGSGFTASGATNETATGTAGTGDRGTGDACNPALSGGGTSGGTGTSVAPPATSNPAKPPRQPQPRPLPSVVAPRVQAPRPDLPLALTIQSYEVVAPDRLSVTYATGLPECYGTLDRAYVSESGDRVLVTLRVRPVEHPSNKPCPDIAMIEDTLVDLDRPLGDRTVVDGVTGQAVTRGHAPSPG